MSVVIANTLQNVGKRGLFQHAKIRFKINSRSAMSYGHLSPTVLTTGSKHEKVRRQRRTQPFSSVSKEEVAKFSEFSKTWWDPKQNPLIGMNSIRVEYILDEMRKTNTDDRSAISPHQITPALSGLKALDVGCGGGLLSESMARLGADVTAVDPSHSLVEHAKRHADMDPRTRSIDYRGGCTIEQLARETSDACYDIICILEVVEHVTDVESILTSAKSLLKPKSGRLFVSTMNRTVKSQIIAIIGAEYIMRYLPPGTHDWNQFRSPEEVEVLMDSAGLQQIDVKGMVVSKLPFMGQWHWKLDHADTDVNWIGTYKIS
mmetsp:Transcript_29705/g.63625  ORF Transcript_29705/g.63625 Transcript_29705/m.63625 type:complete len:318 (+) Transcript_29705:91-1044(+)